MEVAQIIRNQSTSTAKAIAKLQAWARWAISGTPVQNKLTDFLGLFTFLHFVPYNDPKVFDTEISQLWRYNPVEDATETFKQLLSSVMIRRTKAILDLPPRTDTILRIPFDAKEEEYYRCAEQPVIQSLDEFSGRSLPNAIQLINKLRLICNLGLHAPQRSELSQATTLDGSLRETLATRLSLGEDTCILCLGPVSLPSTDDGLGVTTSSNTYYSECGLLYCAACAKSSEFQSPNLCGCRGKITSCHLQPLPSSIRTLQLTPTRDTTPDASFLNDDPRVSSKVCALIQQIQAYPAEKQ